MTKCLQPACQTAAASWTHVILFKLQNNHLGRVVLVIPFCRRGNQGPEKLPARVYGVAPGVGLQSWLPYHQPSHRIWHWAHTQHTIAVVIVGLLLLIIIICYHDYCYYSWSQRTSWILKIRHPTDIAQLWEKQRRKTKSGRTGLLIIQVKKGEAPYEAIREHSSLLQKGHVSVTGSHREVSTRSKVTDVYYSFIRSISTGSDSVS